MTRQILIIYLHRALAHRALSQRAPRATRVTHATVDPPGEAGRRQPCLASSSAQRA